MSFVATMIGTAERVPLPDVIIRAAIHRLCSRTATKLATGNAESDAWFADEMVARAIADEIRVTVQPKEQAALKNVKSVNPDAYEAYLKGRYFWNRSTGDGLKNVLWYFTDAIAFDPNHAEAYSGLADAYALSGHRK